MDLMEVVYPLAFEDEEFEAFAKEHGCLIKKYKAEDTEQIWIVSAEDWAESESIEFLGRIELDKEKVDENLQIVFKELMHRSRSAFGSSIKTDKYKPEWMLHLYYD